MEKNEEKALKFYEKAANLDYCPSILNLGAYYEDKDKEKIRAKRPNRMILMTSNQRAANRYTSRELSTRKFGGKYSKKTKPNKKITKKI